MSPKQCFSIHFINLALAVLCAAQDPEAVPSVPSSGKTKPASSTSKMPVKIPAITFEVFMRDGLRFEPARLAANPGDEITVHLENADSTHQTHNFALLKPGKLKEIVTLAMELGEKGPAQSFVPASSDVLVHSALLDPDKQETLKFKLPAEPGIYPYVCTFPGHGLIMYGALYSGIKPPPIDKDANIPPTAVQSMIAGNGRRPFVQRIFMPDAGPAAIAVALPGTQNFCWDSGQCRLRYAWQGAFIDASGYWKGNGNELGKLSSPPWWKASASEFPIRFGTSDAPAPSVRFIGYRLDGGLPEFHYMAGDAEVFEKIAAGEKDAALSIHYRILKAGMPVIYKTSDFEQVKWTSSKGDFKNGSLTLTAAEAASFTLTLASLNQAAK